MFELLIERQAEKALRSLDAKIRVKVAERAYSLITSFMDGKQLGGHLKGCRSMRSGEYRIIYEVDIGKQLIRILRIGHRKDVYKQR